MDACEKDERTVDGGRQPRSLELTPRLADMMTNMLARAELGIGFRLPFDDQTSRPHSSSAKDARNMPPDRTRTANAQGRQKSCSQCQKGKRRCDLGKPSCARCLKQHLACSYPQIPGQLPATSAEPLLHDLDEFEMADPPLGMSHIGTETLSLNLDVSPLAPADFNLEAGITSLDSLNTMMYNSTNDEDQMALQRAYGRIEKTFSAAHIAPFARSRIKWSMERFKLTPKSMVEENSTPWLHPMLYAENMPSSMQDSYAACALHLARNSTNNEFVTGFITSHAEALANSPLPCQPSELLARAHALMLYQSMLVFEGDISLYSQAELLFPCMEEVGYSLLNVANQQEHRTDILPLYPSAASRASWTAYIFHESLSRTVLAVFQFMTFCSLMRGQLVACSPHLAYGSKLTISAHLWNAKSALDYALAWNSKKYFIVKDLEFEEVMEHAMPEDIDTFSKMMMIGLRGEDDIKGWFHAKGSVL
jgi:hypothetical protein